MKKIKVNVLWEKEKISCAKESNFCHSCTNKFTCEPEEFTYDEYQGLKQTMRNKYGIDETKCKGR